MVRPLALIYVVFGVSFVFAAYLYASVCVARMRRRRKRIEMGVEEYE